MPGASSTAESAESTARPRRDQGFATTRWSLVLAAGRAPGATLPDPRVSRSGLGFRQAVGSPHTGTSADRLARLAASSAAKEPRAMSTAELSSRRPQSPSHPQSPSPGRHTRSPRSNISAAHSGVPASSSIILAAHPGIPASRSNIPAGHPDVPASGSNIPAAGDIPSSGSNIPTVGSKLPAASSTIPSSGSTLPSVEPDVPAPRSNLPSQHAVVGSTSEANVDAEAAHAALARLCQTYWFPLYAHVRRRGFSAHDAEDLTQDFFARLLTRPLIAQANPARGRFRAFILTALNHFLADARDRARAEKRGGTHIVFSFDGPSAEDQFRAIADDAAPPDQSFDRAWALAILQHVLAQLEEEYRAAGKAQLFAALKPTLTGTRDAAPYAELAHRLGANENAVKVAVHRLRRRYRALLQAEVADTVASDADAQAELHVLLQALAR